MASIAVGQRFSITENGHLGKIPVNARGGDKICVLFEDLRRFYFVVQVRRKIGSSLLVTVSSMGS